MGLRTRSRAMQPYNLLRFDPRNAIRRPNSIQFSCHGGRATEPGFDNPQFGIPVRSFSATIMSGYSCDVGVNKILLLLDSHSEDIICYERCYKCEYKFIKMSTELWK